MKILLFALAISLSTYTSNCGGPTDYNVSANQGPAVEKEMTFPSFHGVANSINAEVKVSQGAKQRVEIDAPQKTLDKMEIEVENGILKIKSKRNAGRMAKSYITITIPACDFASISGSGDMEVKGFDGADVMELRVTGSGNLSLDGSANSIEARITGSGDISAKGSANSGSVRLTGSGAYRGSDFALQTAEVRITGSGSANMKVANEITGNITGSGSVHNYGDPKVNMRITGSGKYHSK